jgi:hypothetical protein
MHCTYKDTRFNKHPILKLHVIRRLISFNTAARREQWMRFCFALETNEYLQFQIFYAATLREITLRWHTGNLEAECNRTLDITEEIKNTIPSNKDFSKLLGEV